MSSGSLSLITNQKKTKCNWKSTIQRKQKTVRLRLNLTVNGKQTNLDLDSQMNPDKTVNVHGTVITKEGKRITKTPIDLHHVDINNPEITRVLNQHVIM